MEEIYEKLGLFYLGKDLDKATMESSDVLTLLKDKYFTTHATIIGMTGSGKTGLGVGLIEEAAIDNIPSIIIDPKGDMGNLCLTDPTFSAQNFAPWVEDEAKAKGIETLEYASKVADSWKAGIESWHQSPERVERFGSVAKTIYTPGGLSGIPINIMGSLETPPIEIMQELDLFASYLKTTVTSLLSLIGITGDVLNAKEYILLAQILSDSWNEGKNLSIESLISAIITPPFSKIGVLALDDFYPPKDRFALATKLNTLLASPHFQVWLQGEDLDIQKLLYDEKGKAKIAIFSIGHLSDEERMFFVSLFLNRYIAWMRRQGGTEALKTILYMDEIFGFFPPSKNPPSKEPMLLLLKQARAFGVGVVLSTQNPVDLDYKGLSNIGTWFIGRLQTTQDIDRVIEGLSGQIGSDFAKDEIRRTLANLPKRSFFLKSAHLEDIRLFATRWVLSYLKGPLQRDEIATLMELQKQNITPRRETPKESFAKLEPLQAGIVQYFEIDHFDKKNYIPFLGIKATTYFYNQSKGIDEHQELHFHIPLEKEALYLKYDNVLQQEIDMALFSDKQPSQGNFAPLPAFIKTEKDLKSISNEIKNWIYQTQHLTLFYCKPLRLDSKPYESESDFRVRLQDVLNQKKEEEIAKLQSRFEAREKTLLQRLQRAQLQAQKEQANSTGSMIEAGIAVLGALFGKRSRTSINTAITKGRRVLKNRGNMSRIDTQIVQIEEDMEILLRNFEDEVDSLSQKFLVKNYPVEELIIKSRKSDIKILFSAILWKLA
ncbi:MAG TPA: ATP-binding protein [Epsilonproteobacteria bacterium]|nr:ATP-binding protein [Campylobacterota bacterium]